MAKIRKGMHTTADSTDTDAPPRESRQHAAYESLPQAHRIGSQLRELQTSSRAFERQLAAALGCNPTDLAAMEILIDEGPQSPSTLAARLGVTTAAATHVVDRLTDLGHVSRTTHASDRRRVVVVPAQTSIAAAVEELRPVIAGVAAIEASLSARDRAVIERFLDHVIDCYQRALREDDPPSSR